VELIARFSPTDDLVNVGEISAGTTSSDLVLTLNA